MSARVRIVLVEPLEPGNVGAVTRAMKNFGFDDLVVVGPPIAAEGHALWWSSGAEDLLSRIRYVSSLGEALRGAHLSVATTSMRARTLDDAPLTPAAVADHAAAMTSTQTVAIVFGRENSGLTSDEAALCGRRASIRTSPAFPVMNLAQSVAVFCYELTQPRQSVALERDLAPAELEERMHERAMQLLIDIGYLFTDHPERLYREIRGVAGRAQLTQREVEIFLGALGKLEWRLRQE